MDLSKLEENTIRLRKDGYSYREIAMRLGYKTKSIDNARACVIKKAKAAGMIE